MWPLGWGMITRTGGCSLVCAKALQTWDVNWEPVWDTTCESIVGHQKRNNMEGRDHRSTWDHTTSGTNGQMGGPLLFTIPSLLQGELDCQKLSVAYIIILLCRRQLMGEKSSWMDFIVRRRVLRKHCTYTCIWSKRSHKEMKVKGASGDKGRYYSIVLTKPPIKCLQDPGSPGGGALEMVGKRCFVLLQCCIQCEHSLRDWSCWLKCCPCRVVAYLKLHFVQIVL